MDDDYVIKTANVPTTPVTGTELSSVVERETSGAIITVNPAEFASWRDISWMRCQTDPRMIIKLTQSFYTTNDDSFLNVLVEAFRRADEANMYAGKTETPFLSGLRKILRDKGVEVPSHYIREQMLSMISQDLLVFLTIAKGMEKIGYGFFNGLMAQEVIKSKEAKDGLYAIIREGLLDHKHIPSFMYSMLPDLFQANILEVVGNTVPSDGTQFVWQHEKMNIYLCSDNIDTAPVLTIAKIKNESSRYVLFYETSEGLSNAYNNRHAVPFKDQITPSPKTMWKHLQQSMNPEWM